MIKTRKVYKSNGYDFGEEIPTCSYCGTGADSSEIWETHVCSDFICGEIDCWNEYMMGQVIHNQIECEDEEYEVCDDCEKEEDWCICE